MSRLIYPAYLLPVFVDVSRKERLDLLRLSVDWRQSKDLFTGPHKPSLSVFVKTALGKQGRAVRP